MPSGASDTYRIETSIIYNFLQMKNHTRSAAEFLVDKILSKNSGRLEAFISTWNGLAGRSTTKADDLYVVLASYLDFKLRQFRKFKTLEEKMQRIIFSFSELPFSLFFNVGERLNSDGHHYNRWLPTAVGYQLLLLGSTFVLPHPKISKYSDQGTRLQLNAGRDLALYLIDCTIPRLDQFTILTEEGVYQINPSLAPIDEFQRTGFTATCLAIENRSAPGKGKLRGACFYILGMQNPLQASTGGALVEMVYCCPLVVIVLEGRPQSASEFPASKMSRKCTFWVKFNAIPAFTPLKRQALVKVATLEILSLLCIPLSLLLIIYAAADAHLNGMPKSEQERTPVVVRVLMLGLFILISFYPLSLFAIIIGFPILAPFAFASSNLINYTAYHRSYDDDTVLDRLRRIFIAVAKGIWGAFRRLFDWLWRVPCLRRNAIAITEEFEV